MRNLVLFFSIIAAQFFCAQSKLPIIKATSEQVSTNDGGALEENGWTLSPETKPDIYTADRTRTTKWVMMC